MKPKIVEKAWGTETWIVNTPLYCGKELRVDAGARSSLHRHHKKDETFYVLEGMLCVLTAHRRLTKKQVASYTSKAVPCKSVRLTAGMSLRIKPGTWHRFVASRDCSFIEFSTHHSDRDVERATKSIAAPKDGKEWTDI